MSTEPYVPSVKEMVEAYATCADEYSGEDYDKAKADARRFVAKIKADAWAEGYEAGSDDTLTFEDIKDGWGRFDDYDGTPNPYLKEAGS